MIIRAYLEIINQWFKTGISREHIYRGDFQTLLMTLLPDTLVTNEFEQERSQQSIHDAVMQTFIPILSALEKINESLSDLFVNVDSSFFLTKNENNRIGPTILVPSTPLPEDLFDYVSSGHITGSFGFTFTALKKALVSTTFEYQYHIEFNEYHYTLTNTLSHEYIFRLPYGRFITEDKIKLIGKDLTKMIISDIKTATNLN